jgi:small subunit ribosomal protein S4
MSRYRGPRCRIIRRLGELPGLTQKISKKTNPPGQHGALPKKPSQYRIRLQEKQKLRFHYGITENQLIRIVKKARRSVGSTGEGLLQLLEMRLDTIVYRSGFAPTLPASRQLVTHGHFLVNSKSVNIPRFLMKPGDIFQFKGHRVTKLSTLDELGIASQSQNFGLSVPQHIFCDQKELKGQIKKIVQRTDVSCPVDEQLIIEFYSRKI